ncbi:MAG: hypothetical protein AB8G11_01380 [Saprospiraceae bacterium]
MSRIILVILVLIIGFSNCKPRESTVEETEHAIKQATQQEVAAQLQAPEKHIKIEERADLSFLLKMNGEYPNKTNLFENEPMKTRLENIMGGKYQLFLQRMEVQTPIKIYDNLVFIGGFMEGKQGKEEAAIVVDVPQNLIWCLIYENGKDMNIFKDDRDVQMPNLFILKIKDLAN